MSKTKAYLIADYRNLKDYEETDIEEFICNCEDIDISVQKSFAYGLDMNHKLFSTWQIQQIYNSDVVIVVLSETNIDEVIYELGVIDAINNLTQKYIPVITIENSMVGLPEFVKHTSIRCTFSYDDALCVISGYFNKKQGGLS